MRAHKKRCKTPANSVQMKEPSLKKDTSVLPLDEQMAAARGPSLSLIMFFRAQFAALLTPNVTKRPQRHFSLPSPPPSSPPPLPDNPKSQPASTVPVQMMTSKCPEQPLLSGPLSSSAHSEELVMSQGLPSAIRTALRAERSGGSGATTSASRKYSKISGERKSLPGAP